MGSIRRHRNAMTALLAEYSDIGPYGPHEVTDDFEDYLNKKRYFIEHTMRKGRWLNIHYMIFLDARIIMRCSLVCVKALSAMLVLRKPVRHRVNGSLLSILVNIPRH